jgi:hypothetical protein
MMPGLQNPCSAVRIRPSPPYSPVRQTPLQYDKPFFCSNLALPSPRAGLFLKTAMGVLVYAGFAPDLPPAAPGVLPEKAPLGERKGGPMPVIGKRLVDAAMPRDTEYQIYDGEIPRLGAAGQPQRPEGGGGGSRRQGGEAGRFLQPAPPCRAAGWRRGGRARRHASAPGQRPRVADARIRRAAGRTRGIVALLADGEPKTVARCSVLWWTRSGRTRAEGGPQHVPGYLRWARL